MKLIAIILATLTLTGCAGLGDLCTAANGYQVLDTRTGNVVTIVPMKCAVLRGSSN